MGVFDFLAPKSRVSGWIGYFALEEWWKAAFNENERQMMQSRFLPMGVPDVTLTTGRIGHTTETAVHLLTSLAGWFVKEQERSLAHRCLDKALELSAGSDILDIHFLYDQLISIYYKDREQAAFLEKAIWACRQQIGVAEQAAAEFNRKYKRQPLPTHRGYEQLAIILEKQKSFKEAIALAEEAEKQGWDGDWAGRIERCNKRIAAGRW